MRLLFDALDEAVDAYEGDVNNEELSLTCRDSFVVGDDGWFTLPALVNIRSFGGELEEEDVEDQDDEDEYEEAEMPFTTLLYAAHMIVEEDEEPLPLVTVAVVWLIGLNAEFM